MAAYKNDAFMKNLSKNAPNGKQTIQGLSIVIMVGSGTELVPVIIRGGSTVIAASIVAIKNLTWGSSSKETLFHYTTEEGMNAIILSNRLNASLKAVNPNDSRYGDGQYLTDIIPGSKSLAQLSKAFINNPFSRQDVN
jgi:hypothetical protein